MIMIEELLMWLYEIRRASNQMSKEAIRRRDKSFHHGAKWITVVLIARLERRLFSL
jgi:hypothetical protein